MRPLNRAGGLHEDGQAGGGGIERGQRAEGIGRMGPSERLRIEEG